MKYIKGLVLSMLVFTVVLAGCGADNTGDGQKKIESVTREEVSESDGNVKAPGGETSGKDKSDSLPEGSVNLQNVMDEIKTAIEAKDSLDFNANSMKVLYGIEAEDMKQCAGFSLMEGTFPHEIVMIEAANDEAAKKIEDAFNIKIQAFATQSKTYDAKNYELAKKCKVIKNGRYFAMFLTPEYDTAKTVYSKYIK